MCRWCCVFFFQAEDGIRDLVRSRGLGDVYKRQALCGERTFVEITVDIELAESWNPFVKSNIRAIRLSLIHI